MEEESEVARSDPLPINELRDRVSEQTFAWLEAADAEEKERQAEVDEAAELNLLFDTPGEEDKEEQSRVKEWSSSPTHPDGFGGYDGTDEGEAEEKSGTIRVQYILSSASGGHGDDIWAASRHVANLFANRQKCRQLLSPLGFSDMHNQHPLLGLNFVELGAGGGIPSWTAMWCGARVVCSDQKIASRIQCLAECAERNRRSIVSKLSSDDPVLQYAKDARACPYDWGTPIDEVTDVLGGSETLFDVVLAADCVYIPTWHEALLDSIRMLLAEGGVALLPFALHGNTNDDSVWGIVDLAKSKGFDVAKLNPQQLTPQSINMDPKRGLVHTLRLTKR